MAAKVFNPVGSVVMDEDVELSCDTGCNYVTCKEDMSYEELCTLEGMIALFNHDVALDKEIANLKEECLLKEISTLKNTINTPNYRDNGIDALILMSYINPADIPDSEREEIINDAIERPSILLTLVPEDVKKGWDNTAEMEDA